MEVLELQEQYEEAWDRFVYDSSQAVVYHLAGWKDVMQKTFGIESHYLFAQEGGQVLGVLPLLHINSKLSGHYFTSMPAAICARDEEVAQALVDRAKELVVVNGAAYLILRDSYHKWNLPELVTSEEHCTFVAQLYDDPDEMYKKLDRRLRQHLKKAFKAEVEATVGPEYMADLYPAYAKAMRELGTPTQGLKFFQNVFEKFPDHFTTVVVRCNGEVLGGTVAALFGDTLYTTWAGLLREYYDLRSSHMMYWGALSYGCANGYEWADLGRSLWDSSHFRFKKLWLTEPRPLYQQYFLNRISEPPAVGGARADDVQYRSFVSVWQRLPLSMTEFLGPRLRKRMPFG
jgi:FemAB-related protein (PEP-CTERM system-associated)